MRLRSKHRPWSACMQPFRSAWGSGRVDLRWLLTGGDSPMIVVALVSHAQVPGQHSFFFLVIYQEKLSRLDNLNSLLAPLFHGKYWNQISAVQFSEQRLYDALMFGEINVYEAALTAHEHAANVINRVHLASLLHGFDCSLLATPPTLAETRHRKTETALSPWHRVRNSGRRS